MKKHFLILLLALAAVQLPAQDLAHYKKVVKDTQESSVFSPVFSRYNYPTRKSNRAT
jgi:hypothetical protein